MFVTVLFVCLCPSIASGFRGTELEQYLMKNYSSNVRPATSKNEKTDVSMTMFIQHIESVDDWRQTIKLHGALHTYWQDRRLRWNPTEYNNTESFFISYGYVWTPDVRVLNSVDGNKNPFSQSRSQVLVFDNGFLSFTQDFTFTTSCPLSHKRYPFDRQKCPIVLASMMYDYSQVDWHYGLAQGQPLVIEQRLDWRTKKRHVSGWELLNATGDKAYLTRTGIQYNKPAVKSAVGWIWPMIVVQVEIVRHKPYFYLLEVVPMTLTSILTLTSFWIDAQFLTLTILLCTIIAQGYFSWDLLANLPPATDGMPNLAIGYAFNFSMTCIAFLLHIIIQYLSQQDEAAGFIPPFVSTAVDTMHESAIFGGRGLRLIPNPPSQSDLTQLTPDSDGRRAEGPKTVAKNLEALRRIRVVALVARRVFFWVYMLIYTIFAIVIAV